MGVFYRNHCRFGMNQRTSLTVSLKNLVKKISPLRGTREVREEDEGIDFKAGFAGGSGFGIRAKLESQLGALERVTVPLITIIRGGLSDSDQMWDRRRGDEATSSVPEPFFFFTFSNLYFG